MGPHPSPNSQAFQPPALRRWRPLRPCAFPVPPPPRPCEPLLPLAWLQPPPALEPGAPPLLPPRGRSGRYGHITGPLLANFTAVWLAKFSEIKNGGTLRYYTVCSSRSLGSQLIWIQVSFRFFSSSLAFRSCSALSSRLAGKRRFDLPTRNRRCLFDRPRRLPETTPCCAGDFRRKIGYISKCLTKTG